jgi:hypothetical protein
MHAALRQRGRRGGTSGDHTVNKAEDKKDNKQAREEFGDRYKSARQSPEPEHSRDNGQHEKGQHPVQHNKLLLMIKTNCGGKIADN